MSKSSTTSRKPCDHHQWCILEVLEKCPESAFAKRAIVRGLRREIAKIKCDGFVPIDDVIAFKRRIGKDAWESEMLCLRPSVRDNVFGPFDPDLISPIHRRSRLIARRGMDRLRISRALSSASGSQPMPRFLRC